ncbi:MAG: tyrosine-protein phosphatase [Robiginitomaculum sp.]
MNRLNNEPLPAIGVQDILGIRLLVTRLLNMTIDLNTQEGRKAAYKDLIWGDHGFLRAKFNNHREIGGGMWRANQPSPKRIAQLGELGFKTIINLRGESPKGYYLLEKEACEKHGITIVNHRMYSRDTHSTKSMYRLRDIFEEIAYPAMMHCKSGSDRTGIAGVLYKYFHMGEPIGIAIEQLSIRYLHMKSGKTGMLDFFFNDYLEYAKTHDISFTDWLDTVYDKGDVKARFMSGWIGNMFTDKILRRE